MQKWNGQLLRKFDDPTEGNASVGTTVVVRNTSDNSLAVIYDVDDVNSVQKNNPFVTDDFGRYSFYAPSGKYTVEFGDGSDDIEITLNDTLDFSDVDHNELSNRNAVGAHDAIYRRETTVAEIATGVFSVGDKLSVTDRGFAKFDVVSGGTANGYDILSAGVGKTATLQNKGAINVQYLGASSGDVTAQFQRAAELSPTILVPYLAAGYNVNLSANIGSSITVIFEGDATTQLVGSSGADDLNAIGANKGSYTGVLFSPELRGKNIEVVAGTIRQEQPQAVTSIVRAGTAGIVTQPSHGYSVGDYVVILGASPTGYGGTHEIVQVDSTDVYRVFVDSSLTTPATGTITAFKAGKWEWIKDGTHKPLGVKDDEPVLSDGSGYGLFIKFSKTYSRVLSVVVTPDETIAGAQGMVIGSSVSLDGIVLRASLNKTVAGRVYYDGSAWRVSMGTDQGTIYTTNAPYPYPSISYSSGNLTLNHSFCLGSDVNLTPSSTGGVVPYFPAIKTINDNGITANFIYVNQTTGAFDLYTGAPNTSMSFHFTKNSNRMIKFNGADRSSEVRMNYGNIWFFGIMEV